MLKTNAKRTKENIKNYILKNFNAEGYDNAPSEGAPFKDVALFILKTFRDEKYHLMQDIQYYKGSEADAFADWCAGLPSVIDTCYFYNRSAVADLGAILEETEQERERYDERSAENLLTYLIYRELTAEERKR